MGSSKLEAISFYGGGGGGIYCRNIFFGSISSSGTESVERTVDRAVDRYYRFLLERESRQRAACSEPDHISTGIVKVIILSSRCFPTAHGRTI